MFHVRGNNKNDDWEKEYETEKLKGIFTRCTQFYSFSNRNAFQ